MQQAPSYMQNAPKTRTDETAQASDLLPKLSFTLTGKFTLKQDGETKVLGPTVDIIILAIDPPDPNVNRRAYWVDEYSEDSAGAPDCYSENGVVPIAQIAEPQAAKCADCPHDVLGSGRGKAKACKEHKFIYCVFPDRLNFPIIFKVPRTSLYHNKKDLVTNNRKLNPYRKDLYDAGGCIAGAITTLVFDPDCEYTRVLFRFHSYLPEKEFNITTALAAVAHTQAGISGLLQAAAEAPQLEAPAEKPAAPKTAPVQEEFDFGEDDPVTTILEDLNSAGTKEALQAKYNAHKAAIATWGAEDKQSVKSLVTRKLQEFSQPKTTSPTETCRLKLKNLTDKSLLPDLAADAVKYGLEGEFTDKAAELNDEAYDPEKHGTTKEGLPALCKDGSFKARRGVSKKTEAEEANDAEVDAMLSDIGLDEV